MKMAYKKLGDVCEILDSKRIPITASERKSGQYPYYGANGVQDYVSDFIFDDELVLLAEDGGNFGSKDRPIAYRVSGKCWVNNHAHVLKPLPDIDVDYLCYALMFYDTTGLINGATRQKLTQSAMRQMQIPIRSLDEQKAIVQKISTATGLITLRKTQLQKLDQLASSRFIEMFGDVGSSHFPKVALEDLFKVGSSKRILQSEQVKHGVPFLRISDLMKKIDDCFEAASLFISDQKFLMLKQNGDVPAPGDILITSRGTLGRCYIVKPEDRFYFQDGMISWLSPKDSSISNIYLVSLFRQIGVKKQINKMLAGSTVDYLSIAMLKKLQVVLPPIELQNEFAAFIEQLDKSKVTIRKSIEKLETTYRALLQEYFG